ncbi:hypothetical protein ACSXDI_15585 (plasmid) [Clostridium perfringens]|uniref:hypothetical protein n=1 Tax=Clostridium perfringens TaxID=1502 RepID=UPI001A2F8ADF|nr:hypothetical protein [Clostridium perfringens]
MKKSDLKDGMIVKTGKAIYLVCGDKFLGLNGYMGFENYDENLKIKGNGFEILNINFVYETECWGLGLKDLLSKTTALKLIWERKKEIDWSKVPKWTKVRCKGEFGYYNAYHYEYIPNEIHCFGHTTRDEFTFVTDPVVDYLSKRDTYEIHPSIEIPEEWYKE